MRRDGYSIPKTIWAGVMIWGLCLLVMIVAMRIVGDGGVQWMGLIAALVVGGLITWRIIRTQ